MISKKQKTVIIAISAVFISVLALWIAHGNTDLELNKYIISSAEIPESFEGFRIVHVSDLHNAEIGENNERLLSVIEEAEPDIIAITGDIVDFRRTDEIDVAFSFAERAMKIAPCYYVTGNHEAAITEYDELKMGLEERGVVILDNKSLELERKGTTINLIGVDDPDFRADYLFDDSEPVMEAQLQSVLEGDGGYNVLLSHRPEMFALYKKYAVNLVLSGHTHGGQFRLPFIGGLFSPGQGLFPEYDAGLYTEGETNMIVSRGIGNSTFPFRINNPPEVILIELQNVES